jgi:hypothetical protein
LELPSQIASVLVERFGLDDSSSRRPGIASA